MNKSALKTFAINARKELLKKVEAKAMKIGITEDNIKKADIESSDAIFIDGKQLSKEEKVQRDKLIARINQIGFNQVMEEVAYTWFNRFTALRFMEVNDYLPTDVRVLSSTNPNSAEPDMLNDALELDLDIDKEYVYELKLNNKAEELFKYLIIKHCNDLNRYLPFMFEMIDDYTEILFPEGLLAKDSFIRQMTDLDFIPEDNWQKVEVIGWLYQYYIAEEKDRVIKAKKKYKTEEIPFATQLFTPDWIVRYMVQNSLGRYWIESHPEHKELLENWEFYLENQNHEMDFEEKLAPYINKELKVEEIKCFDPAMGSGHILVYMFDVLYEIYNKSGYMEREIPRLIIENNLYGLDIDDRAYQLACFSVVMKALEYNSRLFRSIERDGLALNLASIQETNEISDEVIAYFTGHNQKDFDEVKKFVNNFKDAKSIGTLINVGNVDLDIYKEKIKYIKDNPAEDLFGEGLRNEVLNTFPALVKQAEIMSMRFGVVISNPPYMGHKYMTKELANYIVENYNVGKTDIFLSFIEMIKSRVERNGHIGLLTPYVWMFLSTYEEFRTKLIEENDITSLIQLEYNSFEAAVVPVCSFTMRNYSLNLGGEYIKLTDFKGVKEQPIKTLEAIKNPKVPYRFTRNNNSFTKIDGVPIAFWVSERVRSIFEEGESVNEFADIRKGLSTGDNNQFLRNWFEVNSSDLYIAGEFDKINSKWIPLKKGGSYRKWYGNQEEVIYWANDGEKLKNFSGSVIRNPNYYFKESISWTMISNSKLGMRYYPDNFIFEGAGPSIFPNDRKYLFTLLAFLCTKVAFEFRKLLNPTMNINIKDIEKLPFLSNDIKEKESLIENLAKENIDISKKDWDSYETSWNFEQHPLIWLKNGSLIRDAFQNWESFSLNQFNKLKQNEEELNNIFINMYKLEDELTSEVEDSEVTIRQANLEHDIKSFISYGVGCSLGRYSLDEKGLVYGGGDFNPERYQIYKVDKDNILPILPGAYFEDDIVSKFVDFVKVSYGEETLNENLDFIAESLGKKKGETAKETIRRYFLNDFFKDHIQTYKKRPIYWLFTSGKQKAFNCLIYMHRYDKTTLSRIRTDYLHEYQIRLDAEKKDLLSIIEGDYPTKEISNAKKELKTLDKKIDELKEYDELLHHMADMQIEIDLDDGVKENYEKFKGLVAKI
ncbi:BREX-1 system adenine-specific DNA-methyltransferase PglX [Oceanobacillus massiliensis]|uniref:BREX-1 system adenine-specific DNA-methyltransferase PglX n=1 Tax=Oceanobacillus massiliensis TaxID=1465765 RepID=UPI00301A9A46